MARLNLPIVDELAQSRSILIAGIGGGFDLFCGLPLYFHLVDQGFQVHLANYSFSEIESFPYGERLSNTLLGLDSSIVWPGGYFPEIYLANWLERERGHAQRIWAFAKTGVQPLAKNYQRLVERLQIDTILLIDGGVDSLARGDEREPGTFIEDSVSLAATSSLPADIRQILVCIGFGTEQDLTHSQILENIAELSRRKAFLGSCSLTASMPEYQAYEAAVLHAQAMPFQDPSVINSSIISATRGEFGDYHLTAKTAGSKLKISPLMPIYWFFEARSVMEQNQLLNELMLSYSFEEAIRLGMLYRRGVKTRPGTNPL